MVLVVSCGLLWKKSLSRRCYIRLSWIGQDVIACWNVVGVLSFFRWRVFQNSYTYLVGGSLQSENNRISILVRFVISEDGWVGNRKILDTIRRTRSVGGGFDHVEKKDFGMLIVWFTRWPRIPFLAKARSLRTEWYGKFLLESADSKEKKILSVLVYVTKCAHRRSCTIEYSFSKISRRLSSHKNSLFLKMQERLNILIERSDYEAK